MIKKKFKIPLYFQNLIVIQTDDFDSVAKQYNLIGCNDYEAVTIDGNDDVIVVFNSKATLSIIAHEAVHVCTYIFQNIGAKIELNNDECFAYLMGWVVDKIESVIKIVPKK